MKLMISRRRFFLFLLVAATICFFIFYISLKNDKIVDDLNQLIDLNNFEFEINHRSCKNLRQQPVVVISVHTAPDHFTNRKAIRETWGFKDPRALLIFFIGSVVKKDLQHRIDVESELHEDIVQGSFIDAYRNLTYKHVMVFKWFVYNCPDTPYLLKLDDDVFVNTPLLYNYLETPTIQSKSLHVKELVLCKVTHNPPVIRANTSKWFVPLNEYPDSNYPDHCQGNTVVYTNDVVTELYQKAQTLPFFWIDDVHVTGIVTSKLHISLSPFDQYFKPLEKALLDKTPFLFTTPNLSETKIRELWKHVGTNATNINTDGFLFPNLKIQEKKGVTS